MAPPEPPRGPGHGRAEARARQGSSPRILAVDREAPDAAVVAEAADALRRGGLLAFPTDTLYALAADPFQPGALARVFAAKGRHVAKAVSLLLADVTMTSSLAPVLPPAARILMERFWPGPLTIIVPAASGMPATLVPPGGGIGLRVPRDRLARAILQALGGPAVGTSANRAGGPEPRDAAVVLRQVGRHLALLLDGGPTPMGTPSTIVDCTVQPPRLIRAGALSVAALRVIVPDLLPEPAAPQGRK